MPTIFTLPEVYKMSQFGKFTLVSFNTTIAAAYADPSRSGGNAVTITLNVASNERIITERYNWGATTVPDSVYYEIHSEQGVYCGSQIRQSCNDNTCTHLAVADHISILLWNVTAPAGDVDVDFSCWYYRYPKAKHEEFMDSFYRRDKLLEQILEELRKLNGSQVPGNIVSLLRR